MSGGCLVVLDRQGRDVKKYPLPEGLATLGSDPACDIRVMLPSVSGHHATVVVHANQTVVRNMGDGETLVNGQKVSVAALSHNDIITLGNRSLRWEYSNPNGERRGKQAEPALYLGGRGRRTVRRGSASVAPPVRDRAVQIALEMTHRASMPGSTGGKQVAIVQPQRRDTSEQTDKTTPRPNTGNKRPRNSRNDMDTSINDSETDKPKRKSSKISPKDSLPNLQNTTKATLWIESRKTSPRKSVKASLENSAKEEISPRKSVRAQASPTKGAEINTSPRKSVRAQSSPTKSVEVNTSSRKSVRAQASPALNVKSQTSSTKNVEENASPRKSGKAQKSPAKSAEDEIILRRSVSAQARLEKSDEEGISPRKSVRAQASLSKSFKVKTNPRKSVRAQASPEKSAEDETSPRKSVRAQASPTKRFEVKTSPRKSVSAQASPEKSAEEETSPRKSVRAQASPTKRFEVKTSPRKSVSAQASPAKSAEEETSPRKSVRAQASPTNSFEVKTSPRKSIKAQTSPRKSVRAQASLAIIEAQTSAVSPRKSGRIQTPAQVRIADLRRFVSSAKKSTPLRMTVLRKAQSAQKMRVTKIQAPAKIDHTKQAALLLMTGHTPKGNLSSPKRKTPSYIVKKQSPIRKTPRSGRKSAGKRSKENGTPSGIGSTPRRESTFAISSKRNSRSSGNKSVTIIITDSEEQNSVRQSKSRRSGQKSLLKSPLLPPTRPKKSSLKDPKRNSRKTESIKFDLSNLENQENTNMLMVTDTTKQSYSGESASDTEITLHYSDVTCSPSPRRPIHSRSSKILEKSLGTTLTISPTRTLTPESPSSRKSLRGSIILQKAFESSVNSERSYSRRTSKSEMSEMNRSERSVESAFRTRTLSPRSARSDIESYSIVDLVSVDSNDTVRSASVYNSVGSTNSTDFGTPQNSVGRKTRSTIDTNFLGSSTPYVAKVATRASSRGLSTSSRTSHRSQSSPNISRGSNKSINSTKRSVSTNFLGSSTPYVGKVATRASSRGLSTSSRSSYRSQSSPNISRASNKSINSTKRSVSTRRSKSLTTPENTQKHISVNSTKISRRSRSRSRINDSDLLFLDGEESDSSPKTSRRFTKASQNLTNTISETGSPTHNGTITPENKNSPQDVGTPVLSIQSLLDSSRSSLTSQSSKKGRSSYKRKTIGVLSENRKRQSDYKNRSLNIPARKTVLRLSKDSSNDSDKTDEGAMLPDNEEVITPKCVVKLSPEVVKNKHSTAKKPQSKRSMIDDLNQSDIVKQLFSSPVKRKLSQSMTEFSRKQLFEDDEDIIISKRPTRNTIALTGRTSDNSMLDHTEAFTPERFVSPINTPSNSPNLSGIKRLFAKNTPENDLRYVRGVKALLKTPRARRSVKNDLGNVSGVKAVFARSPANRLSDVRVKNVFAQSPNNDLRGVSGVKYLYRNQISPKNDLTDVRGVKKMFAKKSPTNDLRNVYGVKRLLRKSPKNDLTDVRGVRKMFREEKQRDNYNVSGVEELFDTSNQSHPDMDSVFDHLLGKHNIKAVYSNTFTKKLNSKAKTRQAKSLHSSADLIRDNLQDWLEKELQKRFNKDIPSTSKTPSTSLTREMNRLTTETVEGTTPIMSSRVRDSTLIKTVIGENERQKSASEIYSARKLPIKKRSLIHKSLDETKYADKYHRLPIKKRVVVHSTPVKGRINITMNASELGRVSPIVAVDKTREVEHDTSIRSPEKPKDQQSKSAVTKNQINRRSVKTLVEESIEASPKPSPKKTGASAKPSPKTKSTRTRKENRTTNSLENTKKRRTSLVITKKSPVLSPKLVQVKTQEKRTRRPKQEIKVQTPKNTRAKVQKSTVVVVTPSPLLKPRATKVTQHKDVSKEVVTRTRQATVNEAPKRSGNKNTRIGIESNTEDESNIDIVNTEAAPGKKGRKNAVSETKFYVNVEKPSPKARTRGKVEKQASTQSEPTNPTRQTRRIKIDNNTLPTAKSPKRQTGNAAKTNNSKGKAVKTVVAETIQPKGRRGKALETVVAETAQPKGRRGKALETVVAETAQPKGRRGKALETVVAETAQPKGRRGKALETVVAETAQPKGRRGKALETVVAETAQPKGRRGKALETAVAETTQPKGRKRKVAIEAPEEILQPEEATLPRGRQRKQVQPLEELKTRGRKAKETELTTDKMDVEIANSKGRKRNAVVETAAPKVTRGRKKTVETTETESVNGTQKRSVVKDSKVEISKSKQDDNTVDKTTKVVRIWKVVEVTEVTNSNEGRRGRRTAPATTDVLQETNKRKRKTNLETSPTKDTKQPTPKKTRRTAQIAVVNSPLKARGRRARGKPETQVISKMTTRTRKR